MGRAGRGDEEHDTSAVIGVIIVVAILIVVAVLMVGGSSGYLKEPVLNETPVETPTS